MPRNLALSICFLLAALLGTPVSSATEFYTDWATFESKLGAYVTDGYNAAGYFTGDVLDQTLGDGFSVEGMSAVIGETRYYPTGAPFNAVTHRADVDGYYGFGSFILDFTATSFGTGGVYGVGLNFFNERAPYYPYPYWYSAHITYGAGYSQNIYLPFASYSSFDGFFGVTSDEVIRSIAFGLQYGYPEFGSGLFGIDNLTIGSARALAEPGTIQLLGLGLAGLATLRRRVH